MLQMIFRMSLEPFDVVLYLKASQLARSGQSVDTKFNSNKDKQELLINDLPVVGYEPDQFFLRDLKVNLRLNYIILLIVKLCCDCLTLF